jgi:hypothetical protein
MSKIFKTTLLSAIISLLGVFLLTTPVNAAKFETGDYTLQQDVVIEEDLYINGKEVVISGIIDGDLLVIGESINIDGTITGDLVMFANSINVTGNVYGNTYSFAQTATFSGILGENLMSGSSSLNYNAQTGEDVYIWVGTGSILGSIGDDLRTAGGQLTVDSLIKGDALVAAGTKTINEEKVTGTIFHSEDLEKALNFDRVKVDIDTTRNSFSTALREINFTSKFVGLISMFIVGAVLINIMPVKTLKIKDKITGSTSGFINSLLVGIAVFIFIPLPIILLLVSFVGAPLGILVIGMLLFVSLFGKLFVEISFGEEILELFNYNKKNYYLSLLTGRVTSVLINFVPILRGFYNFILTATALGAIVRMKIECFKAPKDKKTSTKKTTKKTTKKK